MKNSEAKRLLTAAGFTLFKRAGNTEIFEFDEDIRVGVTQSTKENPHTTREVEQALRRAEQRKAEHESRQPSPIRLSAQEPPRLTAKMETAVVAARAPAPPPAPVSPPPSPPAPPEPEEEETTEKGTRKKGELPMEKRIPLQVRVHAMAQKGIESSDIAVILNREGLRTGSGYEWDTGRINVFLTQHRKLLDLLGTAAPAPVVVPAGVPDYLRGLLLDQSIPGDRKVAALKALLPKLPTSVALMLEDPELEPGQKLAILAIVAQPGGAA